MATNTVTIASGGNTTPTLSMEPNQVPLAIEMPAAFTGTALTFKASSSADIAPTPLYNEGTLYSVTVAQGRYVALNPAVFASVRHLQVVSNVNETPGRNLVIVS